MPLEILENRRSKVRCCGRGRSRSVVKAGLGAGALYHGQTVMNEPANIPVFILCGGLGTRIKEETEFRPKPMVPIGEHPILWHVMQIYARHGFRRFVLCLGFKAEVVKDYFRDFHLHNADCTIKLKTNEVTVHESRLKLDWEVTLAYTGEKNMTGSRVAQAARK